MKAVAAIAAVVFTVSYPALVYFGSGRLPGRTLSIVLLSALVIIHGLQRFAGSTAAGPASKVPLLAIATLGVSVILKHEGFARLVPVVINLGFLALFADSLRQPITMIESFARRVEPELSEDKVRYCRTVTIVWCGFFVLNIAITAVLAFAAPLAWWTLHTGLLAYVAMGMLFAGEYVVRKAKFRDYGTPPRLHERPFAALFPPRLGKPDGPA